MIQGTVVQAHITGSGIDSEGTIRAIDQKIEGQYIFAVTATTYEDRVRGTVAAFGPTNDTVLKFILDNLCKVYDEKRTMNALREVIFRRRLTNIVGMFNGEKEANNGTDD